MKSLSLEALPDVVAVTRLESSNPIPDWASRSSFFSISRTTDELSIVCLQSDVPSNVRSEQGWRAFKVKGPLDFNLTGVLASIVQPLTEASISLFAISTFDTDYILVKQENLEKAATALEQAGHIVERTSQGQFVQSDLRTQRLVLESITEAHAEELCELFADPELHAFVPFEPPTLEQQRDRCSRWAKRRSPDGGEIWLNWMARDLATKRPVGHFQSGVKDDGVASIGYMVARSSQNRGFATEAWRTIFDYLKKKLGVRYVKAWSDTRNLASHRLAQKMGMVQVEIIKDADFFKGSASDEFVFVKELQ